MPYNFILPDLGEGITEGEIRKWLVKEGDAIEEHQTILEIETDKAIVEVPSPKKGRVLKINKGIGDMAKVGKDKVLMVLLFQIMNNGLLIVDSNAERRMLFDTKVFKLS